MSDLRQRGHSRRYFTQQLLGGFPSCLAAVLSSSFARSNMRSAKRRLRQVAACSRHDAAIARNVEGEDAWGQTIQQKRLGAVRVAEPFITFCNGAEIFPFEAGSRRCDPDAM
jgi:hypothetical protein